MLDDFARIGQIGGIRRQCPSTSGRAALKKHDHDIIANTPSKPLTKIDRRHYVDRISKRSTSDTDNTMILPGYEDAVAEDLRLINQGLADRSGNHYFVNGRTYQEHGGTGGAYPVRGEGFVAVDRGTHASLATFARYNGPTDAALREIGFNPSISYEQLAQALWLWSLRTK